MSESKLRGALARIRRDLEEDRGVGRGRLCSRPNCDVCEATRADLSIIEKGLEVLQEAYETLWHINLLSVMDEEGLSSGVPSTDEWEHGFKLVSDAIKKAQDLGVVDTEDPPNEDEDTVLCDCCGCAGNHSMPDGTPCKHANDGVENCALGECGLCQCCMKG